MLSALKTWVATLITRPTFIDYQPADPDALLVLREYGGGVQVRGLSKLDRSVQLLFRSDSPSTNANAAQAALADAWTVYRALIPTPPVIVVGGGKYTVRPLQAPFFLERDASERSVYVFNVAVMAAPD